MSVIRWIHDSAWVRGTAPPVQCTSDSGLHDWHASTDATRYLVTVAAMCSICGHTHVVQVDLRTTRVEDQEQP